MNDGGKRNPFRIPCVDTDDPDPPLPVCGNIENCTCFVYVDHTRNSFTRFSSAMERPRRLLSSGLFVAVSGPDGCGKTSMVNRCAAWALHVLRKPELKLEPFVVDLTKVGRRSDITMDKRRELLGLQLLINAKQDGLISEADEARLFDLRADLESLLPLVGAAMKSTRVLILLMPPSELNRELELYWSAAKSRFIIFAESTGEDVAALCERLRRSSATPTVHLDLGPLRPGDGEVFSRVRTEVPGQGQKFPEIDPNAIDQLIGGGFRTMNIKFAQKVLFGMYEQYLEAPWPPTGRVECEDVLDHVLHTIDSINPQLRQP